MADSKDRVSMVLRTSVVLRVSPDSSSRMDRRSIGKARARRSRRVRDLGSIKLVGGWVDFLFFFGRDWRLLNVDEWKCVSYESVALLSIAVNMFYLHVLVDYQDISTTVCCGVLVNLLS
jgi:hypothetical protein